LASALKSARSREVLVDHFGTAGEDLEAARHRHRRFVVAAVGDRGIVRRPVVAGVLVHLFLRDEFGFAVMDRALAVDRQLALGAGLQVDHDQVLVAHERNVGALRRDLRIGDVARCDLARRVRLGGVDQEQVAADRHQQLLAVRRPVIIDDARQARGTGALATCLFLERELLVRHQALGIDQALGALGLHVVFPEVLLVLVVGTAAQEGHAFAVRRDAQGLHAGAGQGRIAVDAVQRQAFSRSGSGRESGHKEQERAHVNVSGIS